MPSIDPVDYCILTIREDEFVAVLDRLEDRDLVLGGQDRFYALTDLDAGGTRRRVAVARCADQGNLEAADVARAAIQDLRPRFLFVSGIAGAVPSTEFGLGDVVLGTEIHDFTLAAAKPGGKLEYSLKGGPAEQVIRSLLAILPAVGLGGWDRPNALGVARPAELGEVLDVDPDWNQHVTEALEAMARRDRPVRVMGPIASSDTLLQDPNRLRPLLPALRHLRAVEMEAAGIYRAVFQERLPFLNVRGISDVVGLKRLGPWTEYACATAASFLIHLLKSKDVDRLITSVVPTHEEACEPSPESHTSGAGESGQESRNINVGGNVTGSVLITGNNNTVDRRAL